MKPVNNNYICKPIKIEAEKSSDILGINGKPITEAKDYTNHPYQFEVIYAPKNITVTGIVQEAEIKEGDTILVTEHACVEIFEKKPTERLIIWQGQQLHLIRHHLHLLNHYHFLGQDLQTYIQLLLLID